MANFALTIAAGVTFLSACPSIAQSQPVTEATGAPLAAFNSGGSVEEDPTTPAPEPLRSSPDPEIPPAVAKELAALRAEIEALRAELKGRSAPEVTSASPSAAGATSGTSAGVENARAAITSPVESATVASPQADTSGKPAKPEPTAPFAYADWTWLNGSPHNKDAVWDSKFFTPEIRFDTNFISSFNHPKDDSLGGSTEIFRSNEVQIEQISFGGDFHWQNVRGRVLTMGGMFGVTTPRNDASPGRGQWDLRGAYKYFSEAYGGYHFNVNHGLNVDAGIFVSYIGLFSYYNFDNWAYQPSYVSSNTPWFFNGLRIQWFPTDKLKIEPWIINGWQSYGRFGTKPGLGGQILYRPRPWVSLVFNNYGMGEDTLWTGNTPLGRSRIHTDNSVEIKYYDHPERRLDKMAFSLTGDLGCEYGGGVSCFHNQPISGAKGGPRQSFAGWMLYNRWWFNKDKYAITVGGGAFDNPGRYLTLLQPINGADAISGSPYFPASPGSQFKAWDTSFTFDYMPKQYITFLWEYGYRHANVPYFTGRGGITPPGGNNGNPAQFVCMDDTPDPTGAGCAAHGGLWTPDLRKDEPSLRMAIMVKF
ncbi:MAG TPA: outer membrane beta-barrel protein [Candidatus Sulfotelmatobacter sp.]